MWKLDFFLLPSYDYEKIGIDEAKKLNDNLDYLQKNERVYIPSEFYDSKDKNHITIYDYVFREQNELTEYLLEILSKQKQCDVMYEALKERDEIGYLGILREDIRDEIEAVFVEDTQDREKEKVIEVNDVVKVKRHYIKKVDSFEKYKERAEACFPYLVFHEEAFKYISSLGKCSEIIEELTHHLSTLNDAGKKLYEYYEKNEKMTLYELKSSYKIICSGKGSKEEKAFNKEMIFNGQKYQLTCNPHTKLFQKKTDQRIYFCWGRSEIREHSIIIVRIGNHWEE